MIRRSTATLALVAGLLLGIAPSHAELVLVPENNNNDVLLVNTATGATTVFANTGLDNPIGIDIGNGGNVYVANNGSSPALGNTISEFSPSGALIRTFGGNFLTAPQGLTTDSAGNVYVANPVSGGPDEVDRFAPNGTNPTVFVTEPNGSNPYAVLFDKNTSPLDPNRGNLFKTDANTNQVLVYSPAGTLLQTLGNPAGSPNAPLHTPDGLVLDASGNLYVASAFNNAIVRFDVTPVTGIFGAGTIVAQDAVNANLFAPIGLLFDASGNLLVSNYANGIANQGFIESFSVNPITGDLTDQGTVVSGLNGPTFLAPAPSATAVPEPGSVTLLGTGLVVMLVYGWRRTRASAAAAA